MKTLAVWMAFLFLSQGCIATTHSNRKLYRLAPQTCENTMQGRYLIADDKGKLCQRSELDHKSGCCKGGKQNDCGLCNADDSCCSEFESCVSCCLSPDNRAQEKMKQLVRAKSSAADRLWPSAFEYCRGMCRTHSKSTSHENSYIGARHHCFSDLGKPMLSQPLPKGALDGVTVVLGASGQSCVTACQASGKQCSLQHMPLLNSCDRLREVVACEAGCVVEAHKQHFPAYVDTGAPKTQRPAMCLAASGMPASWSCDAKEAHVSRLCPCAAGAAAAAAAAGR